MEIIWLQVIPIKSMEILPIGMGQGISGSLKLILKEIYCGKNPSEDRDLNGLMMLLKIVMGR